MKHEFLPLPAGYRMSEERRESVDFLNTLKTFHEWSTLGYKIIKGSKHVSRNDQGGCLFSGEQVTKYSPPEVGEQDDDEREYDQDLPGNPADYGSND